MRELRLGVRVGALLMGVGLASAVALPAAAQDDTLVLVTEDAVLTVGPEGASVTEPVELTPQEAFTQAFLACVAATGDAGECTEEVLEDLGLEEEEVILVDPTPLNPVDVAGTEAVEEAPLAAGPPLPDSE